MFRRLFTLISMPLMLVVASSALAVCSTASIPETTPTSAFTDHGNGTVTHVLTGLMWKKCPQGLSGATCTTGNASQLTWSGALASAVNDPTGGHNNWRLPSKKELESIVEECRHSPAINLDVFPGTPAQANFWSSTTYGPDPATGWDVDFTDGATFADDKTITSIAGRPFLARLVRATSPFDAFDAQQPIVVSAVLDVDLSVTPPRYDALTDGLLVIRYLFGLTGPSLTLNALGGTAQRTDPAAIKTYLDGVRTQLDIDGNGVADALSDGLLIVRYLFGLRGASLISGAFDPAGSRTTAPLIEAQIQSLMP